MQRLFLIMILKCYISLKERGFGLSDIIVLEGNTTGVVRR